jgi:2-hydroxy-6-oxonona-2,4-dienedioate hydrolase
MIPLVLVHGFMGGSDQWEPQSPLKNTVPLIAVDLPGFGKNAHLIPINSIEKLARWVLDKLTDQGVERFLLLGHSMGGMVVQDMIRQAPDRVARLVLYSTGALGLLPGRFEPIETSMQRAKDDGAKARRAGLLRPGSCTAKMPKPIPRAQQSPNAAALTQSRQALKPCAIGPEKIP